MRLLRSVAGRVGGRAGHGRRRGLLPAADPAPPTQQTQCVQVGRGDPIDGGPAAQTRLRFEDA